MGVFTMPSLGADMDSGRIVEWLVQPGDKVHRGDVIAVLDTTKAAIEVEVFEDGTVTELLVAPGTEVEVGAPLAVIAPEGTEPKPEHRLPGHRTPSAQRATPPVRHLAHQLGVNLETLVGSGPDGKITRKDIQNAASPPVDESDARPIGAPTEPSESELDPGSSELDVGAGARVGPPPRLRITPRARQLAARHNIELHSVTGTGTDGAITGHDIELAIDVAGSRKAVEALDAGEHVPDEIVPDGDSDTGTSAGRAAAKIAHGDERRAMRRSATAALMARAAREIPHYYVSQTIDLTGTLDWLSSHNAELPVRERVLPAALFLRGTVQAAQQVSELNGHWVDDSFRPADGVQLGVAVAIRDGGLLTPVILDAHLLGLDELMAHLTDLVRRARHGRLQSREIAPGSITVSSLADGGPDALFAVIYPPQVALVGIGGIAERPWAIDGALAARSTVTLTVAADHRATDGRIGAAFLAALSSALTRPEDM